MIRPARLNDIDSMLEIALLTARCYPLRPDKLKIRQLLIESISSAANFSYISEDDSGVIKGALVAFSSPGLWFERKHLSVELFYTTIRGDGIAMLRRLMEWKGRGIKVSTVSFTVDERLGKLFARFGFRSSGQQYIKF